jgi:hypothetical protein
MRPTECSIYARKIVRISSMTDCPAASHVLTKLSSADQRDDIYVLMLGRMLIINFRYVLRDFM